MDSSKFYNRRLTNSYGNIKYKEVVKNNRIVKSMNNLSKSLSSNYVKLKVYPNINYKLRISGHECHLYLTQLYKGIKLYQGTQYKEFVDKSNISKYYDYYDKRHNGSYFVSTLKISRIYSKKKGQIIMYRLSQSVNLIDLGNINNLNTITALIDKHIRNPFLLHGIKQLLLDTCLTIDEETSTIKCNRRSIYEYDNLLVNLFKETIMDILWSKYGIKIDGWINYDNEFHDEILLFSKNYLKYNFTYI